MRRHRKAPSAGSTTSAHAKGAFGRLSIAIFGALLAAMLLGTSAQAAPPTYLGSFNGADITPAPTNPFTPGRLAVNEETGDVYVIDSANDAIRVFDSEGNYESSILGSSITPGAETLGIGAESDIAIDNSGGANKGRIYVNSESAGAVFAFNPNGSFAWEKTGFSEICGVAVDAAGNPWSGEYPNGVQKLSPTDGTPDGNHVAAFGRSCEIAFDSAANLYVRDWGQHIVDKFAAPTYDLPGAAFEVPRPGFSVFDWLAPVTDVDVNRESDDVYLAHGTDVTTYGNTDTQHPLLSFESSVAGHAYLGVTVNSESNTVYVSDEGNSAVEIWGPPSYPLNVATSGTGLGSVKCDGGPCDPEYLEGTEVTLEAVPAAHSTFSGWAVSGGDPSTCTGTTNPCTITVGEEVFADAAFAPVTHTVTVAVTGKGSVSANSGAIVNCTASGGTCSGPYAEANTVLLTATPSAHQKFTGWSGCDAEPVGTGKCQVNVDANESVTATFAPIVSKLTIAKAGSGSGSITCNGGACAPEYEEGTTISIAASAAAGSSFAGFAGGGCSASPCNLTLGADTTVTGTFNANPVIAPPAPNPPLGNPPKQIKCKKGFKKKTVKGKSKCVKVKKKKSKGKGKH